MPNEQIESETRWSTVSDEPQTNSEAGAADGVCVQEVCVQEGSVKEIPVPELVAQEVETTGPRPALSLVTGFDELFETIEDQWQERALCAQTDPEAFFPEKGGSTREAKRICLGCEVRDECLDYALANDERFGIWGGLSERERRRLKRADRLVQSSSPGKSGSMTSGSTPRYVLTCCTSTSCTRSVRSSGSLARCSSGRRNRTTRARVVDAVPVDAGRDQSGQWHGPVRHDLGGPVDRIRVERHESSGHRRRRCRASSGVRASARRSARTPRAPPDRTSLRGSVVPAQSGGNTDPRIPRPRRSTDRVVTGRLRRALDMAWTLTTAAHSRCVRVGAGLRGARLPSCEISASMLPPRVQEPRCRDAHVRLLRLHRRRRPARDGRRTAFVGSVRNARVEDHRTQGLGTGSVRRWILVEHRRTRTT